MTLITEKDRTVPVTVQVRAATPPQNAFEVNVYGVMDFTNVLGRLVEGVRGEWTFTPDGKGTIIRWRYEFKPRRGHYFLVRRVLAPFWRRYMLAGIEAAARACE